MTVFNPVAGQSPSPPSADNYAEGDVWFGITRERFNGSAWVNQPATTVSVVTPGATPSIDPTLGDVFTLTPAEDETISMASLIPGQRIALRILTAGTSSKTLTFSTRFKTTGTLATGTADAKTFVMSFVCDGVNYVEQSRTAAM
jgi:hypothetical protein